MSEQPPLVVGYLVSRYPSLSHTFIRREVQALRARGMTVHVCSIRPDPRRDQLSGPDRDEIDRTTVLLPPGSHDVARALRLAARHPAVVLHTWWGTTCSAPPGMRRRLWRAFYMAEALLVWDWSRRHDVTHVHAHFANVASDVAILTTSMRRAVGEDASWSFTMHGPTEFADQEAHGLRGKVADADAIACISYYCRSQLMMLCPPDEWSKLQLVRCGLEPDRWLDRSDGTNERPRAAISSSPPQPIRLVSVGRLVPEKAFHVFLDAVEELGRRSLHVVANIVGDGPERSSLERRIREIETAQPHIDIQLAGAIGNESVLRLLADADVFASASFSEGLPVVIMEAMAARAPVVATRIAAVPELIEDGVTGWVVPPGEAMCLADAIERASALAPADRQAITDAAFERVRSQHDVRDAACTLEQMFRQAAIRPAAAERTNS